MWSILHVKCSRARIVSSTPSADFSDVCLMISALVFRTSRTSARWSRWSLCDSALIKSLFPPEVYSIWCSRSPPVFWVESKLAVAVFSIPCKISVRVSRIDRPCAALLFSMFKLVWSNPLYKPCCMSAAVRWASFNWNVLPLCRSRTSWSEVRCASFSTCSAPLCMSRDITSAVRCASMSWESNLRLLSLKAISAVRCASLICCMAVRNESRESWSEVRCASLSCVSNFLLLSFQDISAIRRASLTMFVSTRYKSRACWSATRCAFVVCVSNLRLLSLYKKSVDRRPSCIAVWKFLFMLVFKSRKWLSSRILFLLLMNSIDCSMERALS